MNQKHNPYVAIVALLLLAIVVTCVCGGCYAERTEATEVPKPTHRFTVEPQSVSGLYIIQIITDTETGVQYLFYRNLEGAGLCKLEGGTNDVR